MESNMKTKFTALFLALVSAAAPTIALAHESEGYNLEVEYNSHQVKHVQDNGAGQSWSDKNSTTNWLFTYYFDEISTDTGPRLEAAFLNRANSLTMPGGGNESSLGFEYFGEDYDFYVSLQNEENIHDQIHLGWMVDTNWLVAAHGKYSDFNGGTYGIYTKKVFSLDNGGFFNIKAGYDKTRYASSYGQETEQFYAEMDYYVDQDLSFGLTIADNEDRFGDDDYSVEYRANWFVTDEMSLGLSYTDGSAEQTRVFGDGTVINDKVDHILSAQVKWRF
jgi:hypothetical protein